MEIKLKTSDEDLKKNFLSLSSRQDVADLLEITDKSLVYILYRNQENNYKEFTLTKKSGGIRQICSPVSSIKILQKKLSYILSLVYKQKPSAHGFVQGRNVLTNSKPHLKKQYVLNLDLSDFFPSINFGRVRGMFMGNPYNLPKDPATILAQLSCHKNSLPQGASTSPIISNMICARLDSQFQKLAKIHSCSYTRYADDITFSATTKDFPKELGWIEKSSEVFIGDSITKIISDNGFKVNKEKTRLKSRTNGRLEVTGLTVNEFPNVPRSFIRQIRAMLNAWEKYGLDFAEKEHNERYSFKQRNPELEQPKYSQIVKGKINYVRMIRGESDRIYRTLAIRYNDLAGGGFPNYYRSEIEEISSAIWVLEGDEKQGTAFMLDGVGLVTCYHVLEPTTQAFKHDNYTEKYPVTIIRVDKARDIAIIKIGKDNLPPLKANYNIAIIGERITIVGFPNYNKGNTVHYDQGIITSYGTFFGVRLFLISASIVFGNSGGPILNENNEVIGIVVRGSESFAQSTDIKENGVIPISLSKDFLLNDSNNNTNN